MIQSIKDFFNTKYGYFYRTIMRIAHKYNWHYAPQVYPDGDTMLWCQWCGFREVIRKRDGSVKHFDFTKNEYGTETTEKETEFCVKDKEAK